MTVKELMKHLGEYPEDMKIITSDELSYKLFKDVEQPVKRLVKKQGSKYILLYPTEKQLSEDEVLLLW